jgi:hypothetical protein
MNESQNVEYKVIEVGLDRAEMQLNDLAEQRWRVVSASTYGSTMLAIILERARN